LAQNGGPVLVLKYIKYMTISYKEITSINE